MELDVSRLQMSQLIIRNSHGDMIYSFDRLFEEIWEYEYNERGDITRRKCFGSTELNESTRFEETFEYEYNQKGLKTYEKSSNGDEKFYKYDDKNRLIQRRWKSIT